MLTPPLLHCFVGCRLADNAGVIFAVEICVHQSLLRAVNMMSALVKADYQSSHNRHCPNSCIDQGKTAWFQGRVEIVLQWVDKRTKLGIYCKQLFFHQPSSNSTTAVCRRCVNIEVTFSWPIIEHRGYMSSRPQPQAGKPMSAGGTPYSII